MKTVIRSNCFETNSSSMHSIVVTKDDKYDEPDVFIDKNGEWGFWRYDFDFGRCPLRFLTSFEDKFSYALSEYLGHLYPDDSEYDVILGSFERIAHDAIPECQGLSLPSRYENIYLDKDGNHIKHRDLIYNCWDKKTNAEKYWYIDSEGNKQDAVLDEEYCMEMPNINPVDHQSAGILKQFIKDKEISLREFLTNSKYIIVLSGDEYDDLHEFKASVLYNSDSVVEWYPADREKI